MVTELPCPWSSLSELGRKIWSAIAPVRTTELGMVIYFAGDRLYCRKKYGSTDFTFQFSGIRVDEQGGPVRHDLPLPPVSPPAFNVDSYCGETVLL